MGALQLFALLLAIPLFAADPIKVSVEKEKDHDLIKLENYRVALTINPFRGGAVTSWSDKLAPAEWIIPKENNGLCMDHFQEQPWPGEFLEAPYEYKILKQTPEEIQVQVSRKASGLWRSQLANAKLSNVVLEKIYIFKADSPALLCNIKLTAPAEEPKVVSYWMQHVLFAGGDYDPAADRVFRPTARGVRSSAEEGNGHYGKEEWLRDGSDGWMAIVDTKKKSGLATFFDYNDLRISYACGGNRTVEPMFNTAYIPKGQSREYALQLAPIVGVNKLLYAGPRMIVGYAITSDNQGGGKIDFQVERSTDTVKDATLEVTLFGPSVNKEAKGGRVTFGALTDQPQTQTLNFSGAPPDPLVVRVKATGHDAEGKEFTVKFEDFFPGAYQWGDNIQTDMRTPFYSGKRPVQVLKLARPPKLKVLPQYHPQHIFFQGLLDEEYNVAGALHTTSWMQRSDLIYYRYGGSWFGELTDFPYDYDQLLKTDCIVLGGVSKSGLKAIGVEMLHDYLVAGGGMVVLGSHGAYGKSQLKGTPLGDAFPVEMSDQVCDLKLTGGTPVTLGPEPVPFLKDIQLGPKATCYLIHPVKVKNGAKVVMQAGDQPLMVIGEYGANKARIVCILGAPMGNPGKDQVPFWQADEWYLALRNAIWWASHKDDRFAE